MYLPQAAGKEIKIVSDPKKLTERCKALKCYINNEVPDMPKSICGKRKEFSDDDPSTWGRMRQCPRCIEKDKDAPNLLMPREQYCFDCKKY